MYVASTEIVNLATIVVELVNVTSSAVNKAPVVALIAVTRGTATKLVPEIVTEVCVFSITDGLIDENVGLVSPCIVTEPPRLTLEPLIVIAEFVKALLGSVLVEAPDTKFASERAFVILPRCTWYVVTSY